MLENYAEMLFAEYCDIRLSTKKKSLEITTYEGYAIRISHIKDFFAPRKTTLLKAAPRDIKEFYDYLLCRGNKAKYRHSDGLSSRTIKEIALCVPNKHCYVLFFYI